MATTYAELQAEVADFLNRDDLTAVIPTFIQLAEANLNRMVKHWRQEQRSEALIDDRFLTLPADWLQTIRVTVDEAGYGPLQLISRDDMHAMRQRNLDTAGTPCYYAHVAGELELYPTPASEVSITLLYQQQIPDLATNSTNWLLDIAPDLYLYATLLETAIYLRDDNRIAAYSSIFGTKLEMLNMQSKRATESGTGLKLPIRSY